MTALRHDDAMKRALALQGSLGAADVDHPGGALLTHLRRVYDLTMAWDSSPRTQLAALCHATYGTDGFPHRLLPTTERARVREAIGADAESLVYLYAACDRDVSYARIGGAQLRVRDRFGGTDVPVDGDDLTDFAVLTVANELDVARFASPNADTRSDIRSLVGALGRYAPTAAARALEDPALR